MKIFIIPISLLLTSCTDNITELVKAAAADPATACISVGSPYGTIAWGRTNIQAAEQTGAARVTIAGGQCLIETGEATR